MRSEECVTQRRGDTQREHTQSLYRKGRKSSTEGVHTRTEGKQSFPLQWRGRCAICLDNNASEAEVITDTKKSRKVNHKKSLKHWTECSVLNSIVRVARTNFGRQHLRIMYQSMLKECVVKVVNKSEDENYSQDNFCLERTRSNTPKHLGSWRLRRLVQF